MKVVGDLFTRDRRSDHPALRLPDGRVRTYHEFITNTYKAGNALSHEGVRRGTWLAIEPELSVHPILAFFGAAMAGAGVRFSTSGRETGSSTHPQAILVPPEREGTVDVAPGTTTMVYGGKPEEPETVHWESVLWSENPAFPPIKVDPGSPVLADDAGTYTHDDVLEAARAVVTDADLDRDVTVVVRSSPADARTVVAGLLAPVVTGASIALPPLAETEVVPDQDVIAVVDSGSETGSAMGGAERHIPLSSVPLSPTDT